VRRSLVAAVAACVLAAGCGSESKPRAVEPSPEPVVETTTAEPTEEPAPSVPPTSAPVARPTAVPTTRRPTATSTPKPPPPPAGGGISTNRKCETAPAASTGGPGRQVTPAAPLDLLITGDSLQESMGPRLAAYANAKSHMVAACTVPKYSTGLVRDDFFDWPAYARQLASQRGPEAVSFMIGGNDGQNMSVNGRVLAAGSPEWAAEYQRRAASVMRAFTAQGAKVYWIGMPIARSERLTRIYTVQNDAVRRAAAGVAGVQFVDIWAMFAPGGRYQDSFANEYGTVERMRSSDGIHLSTAGAAFLARRMLQVLNADWHLTA
jgi:hypothetical protein